MLALVEGLLRTTEWRNQKRERVCVAGGFIGDVLMDNFKVRNEKMHYYDLADNGRKKNLRDKSIGYNLAFFIYFLFHSIITICHQCRAVSFRVGASLLCSLECLCEFLHDDCAEKFC
ncbi:hypothetical protein KIL84_005453 [Mauremys mutica]|uniref:Uncharacterized protein n=1 Tax=Mauremys mutica TaxID=74926 RepID=A0A9D3XL97_9SAUR|nr:hypothetical protein KIL84_005453 [Mauremys mutica]